jgi:hypothetical protein
MQYSAVRYSAVQSRYCSVQCGTVWCVKLLYDITLVAKLPIFTSWMIGEMSVDGMTIDKMSRWQTDVLVKGKND